jgi:hypothetical protein
MRRFGNWGNALAQFRDWAKANDPDFPYFEALGPRRRGAERPLNETAPPRWASKGGRPCGDLVAFRALARAPVNEGGVVLAFGMVADELGFSINTVGTAFPDCAAKRRVGAGRWEEVRIEFEYRSRNFRDHAHDPAGCDLIVCWEHDWPDYPLEVLELRAAIAGCAGAPGRDANGLRQLGLAHLALVAVPHRLDAVLVDPALRRKKVQDGVEGVAVRGEPRGRELQLLADLEFMIHHHFYIPEKIKFQILK